MTSPSLQRPELATDLDVLMVLLRLGEDKKASALHAGSRPSRRSKASPESLAGHETGLEREKKKWKQE